MRYLVTGGAGFIGSHLVDRLLEGDSEVVVVVDNLSERGGKRLRVGREGLEVHEASILDDKIGDLFRGVDAVFHLAALPRPQLSIIDPVPAHNVNATGTLNVLMGCKDFGVGRMVFISSASVYGEQDKYPCAEGAVPNPMSPYALHKLIGEQYCQLFTQIYGLETNCMRLFNVYGTRMNPHGEYSSLIPKFIRIIKSGERPTINGHGKQARDFVHVRDVVEALVLAAHSDVYGEVFNVGSGVNVSVNEVFRIICQSLRKEIQPIHGPPVIEPTQTLANRGKILSLLGWEPRVDLEHGIWELATK